MAARKVHSFTSPNPLPAMKTPVKHEPLPGLSSPASPVELTVKVAAARAGFVTCKLNNDKSANIIARPEPRAKAFRVRFASVKKK